MFMVNDVPYILPHHKTGQPIHADNLLKTAVEVLEDTICQCTGLKDKNGKLIWENDIVRCVYDCNEKTYIVIWDDSEVDFKATNGKENYGGNFQYLTCCEEIEILGNIFDNPKLLEGNHDGE